MPCTVDTCTVNVFTGATGDSMTFADITVLLVRMTAAQVSHWSWVGDMWDGAAPVKGYEVRDATGALLGAILPLGHIARRYHVEWYDPTAEDFFAAGETDAVRTQGVARIIDQRSQHVGTIPAGEEFAEPPHPRTRLSRSCPWPWLYCFDPECAEHSLTWVKAA